MKACLLRFEDATENRRLVWSNLFYIQILKSGSHMFAEESVFKVSSHPIPTESTQKKQHTRSQWPHQNSLYSASKTSSYQKFTLSAPENVSFQLSRWWQKTFGTISWLDLVSFLLFSQTPVTSITAVHSVHSATLMFFSITCPKSSIV